MESSPKASWSRKSKLKGKMEQMREAKLAKSYAPTSSAMVDAQPEPTTSGTPGESSEAPSVSLQGAAGENEAEASTESLDESLRVPVTPPLSDESSESDEASESFSNDDAQQVYQGWLNEQPKHVVKMIAVMFMDALIDRFNITWSCQ